jgi:dihydroflavonol-4-reductase
MILVTGGTGLLGSHLIHHLLQHGKTVRILKRSDSSIGLLEKYIKEYQHQIEWAIGDIMDVYSLLEAMEDVDTVYHCAAIVSFSKRDIDKMMRVNITGTANVVNAALNIGVKKLCHVSSIAAIGRSEISKGLINEDIQWKTSSENSNYAISKYGAEREVWRGIAEGLDAVIVNPSVIIGSGNWNTGSAKMFSTVWKGLKYYTEGVNGFVDVKDVAKVMVQLTESDIKNERFIVSSENYAFRDFFNVATDVLGKKRPSIKINPLLSEIVWRLEWVRNLFSGSKPLITKETARSANKKYYYNNEKLTTKLNFSFISIEQSIVDTAKVFLLEKK